MQRMFDEELVAWKDAARRKPLIVRGARQVGKTTSIARFGRERFEELAEVDLERRRSVHRVFDGDLDADRILSQLRVLLDRAIVPGRTLLFLDEIQACPRALLALRYLYEQIPELHVVAAGSLLEFALAEARFPVGRVQFAELFPMGFTEFLRAVGRHGAAEITASAPGPLDASVHESLLDLLRSYLFVGGMPESVKTFVETRSYRECFDVQRELCDAYREDFSRYAPRVDPHRLDAVLLGIARHAGQAIKYTRLAEGAPTPTAKRAFDLLIKARVADRVRATSPSGLPLGAQASGRKFKALMVDVGLLQQLRGLPWDLEYPRADLLAIHEGALAEQFVGQELRLGGASELYYWARSARGSSAEVDYLTVSAGTVVPVEVKRGPAGRLRSLHLLLDAYPSIPRGVVLSSAPYAELPERRITFVPLYFAASVARAGAPGSA